MRLIVDADGILRGFDASGHAGSVARGANLACAAASALLRTAGRLCAERGIVLEGGAEARGSMRCRVAPRVAGDTEWLRGVTAFLARGLQDLRDEFPKAVSLDTDVEDERGQGCLEAST